MRYKSLRAQVRESEFYFAKLAQEDLKGHFKFKAQGKRLEVDRELYTRPKLQPVCLFDEFAVALTPVTE